MTSRTPGRPAVVLALVAAGIFVVSVRALVAGHAELAEAETLRRSPRLEDLRDAVGHYRRAASWYVPGSPHVPRALDALARVARAAEDVGRRDLALSAWRGVRSASATARAPWPPDRRRLAEADRALARLTGRRPPPVELADPRPWAAGLAVAGLAAFVGGVLAWLRRGFDGAGRPVGPTARRAALVALAGAIALVAGLTLA